MLNNLLISNETLTGILIAAACVLAVSCFLYGVFKKFTQMSWLAWQIPLVAAIAAGGSLLFEKYAAELGGVVKFAVSAALIFAATGLVLGLGGIIRWGMHKRYRPAPAFLRFCNRLLGGLTAVLNFAVFALVLASAALPFLYYVLPEFEVVSVVYRMPIWDLVLPYLFDLFTAAVFVLFIRTGWRVGFGRAVLYIIMLAATLVAFVVSLYATLFWSFLQGITGSVAGWFTSVSPVAATLIADAIVIVVVFLILFVVLCLVGWLFSFLLRRINYLRVFGFIDGFLLAVLSFVCIFAVACAFDFAVGYVASGALSSFVPSLPEQIQGSVEGVLNVVTAWAQGLAALLRSAPYSRLIYDANLLPALIPGA